MCKISSVGPLHVISGPMMFLGRLQSLAEFTQEKSVTMEWKRSSQQSKRQ